MKTTREKLFATSGVALDLVAAGLLCAPWAGAASAGRIIGAVLVHGAAAAAAALALRARAGRIGLDLGGRGGALLCATAALLMPIIGPMALAALLTRIGRHEFDPDPRLARAPLRAVAHPLVGGGADDPNGGIGEGSLEARLRFDPDPASRTAAVLATRRLVGASDANRLLRLALSDRHDDVRLLAHALLDDRDRRASEQIDALERQLRAATAERRGVVACLLAEALLDLGASGLVSGELEAMTLRRARAVLEEAGASARGPSDVARPSAIPAKAAFLRGRVLLRQGDRQGARRAFEDSQRLGVPGALLAPYVAQLAFEMRNAGALREVRA